MSKERRPPLTPNRFFQAMSQGQGSKTLGTEAPINQQNQSIKSTSNDQAVVDAIKEGVPVTLPPHLYIPKDAQSLDLKNLFDINPGVTQTLIEFTCPKGAITVIQYYSIFNDGLLAADFDFFPTVDNRRIYQFHGDSLDNFRIYLGTGPDLSNNTLVVGTLYLQPGQTLRWQAQNRSGVVTSMGARVVGYVDYATNNRSQTRFGG